MLLKFSHEDDLRLCVRIESPCDSYKTSGYKHYHKKVQVGKDQEKAQSAKDSHSKSPRWEKTKLTIRYLYHENIS